jgi:signal transduction histidine kinase
VAHATEAGPSPDRTRHYAARLYSLTAALSEAVTPAQVARVVLSEGIPALGATAGFLSVLEENRSFLGLVGSVGYSPERSKAWSRIATSAALPLPDAVRTREPVWIESRARLLERYPVLGSSPAANSESRAWAIVPLLTGGEAVGGITFGFPEERHFTDEDRDFAFILAHQCAQALERAWLYESERTARLAAEASQRRFAFLAEASEVLAQCASEEAIFSAIVRLVIPRLADWMTIRVVAETGELLSPVLAHVDPALEGALRELQRQVHVSSADESGAGRVLRTGEPEFFASIPDALLSQTVRPSLLDGLRRVGMKGYITVAIQAQGAILGILTLVSAREDRVFTPDDLLLARDFARRLALAIDNARVRAKEQLARKQAQEASRRATFLARASAAMSEAATPRQVAGAVLSQAIEALGARDGAVWECHPGQETLELVHVVNYPAPAIAHFNRIPLAAKVPVADAARTGSPIWLEAREDYRTRYPEAEAVTHSPDREYSSASLPMWVGGTCIGALALTFSEARSMGPEERDFLLALARQCTHAFERARLYREAEDALAVRDEFLSIASHELKTPLTSLKLHIQTALQGSNATLVARGLEKLKRADRQIGRLTELIEEMLDLSRIRTGRLKLNLEPMDLAQVARGVVASFQEQAEQMGIPIALQCTRGVEGTWDRSRMEQVLTNLVSNAMKYGERGPIQVDVEARGDEATVTVTDHGIGISPEDLDRLFRPFQRTRAARNYGGLGLGLYICRQIVEAMGGTISVKSQEGVGSSFSVRLPSQPGRAGV